MQERIRLLGATSCLHASASGDKEATSRADYCQDNGWIFRRVSAACLSVKRKGKRKEESEDGNQ